MSNREFDAPIPDGAEVVYDTCLQERVQPTEFIAAWYGIYRTAFYADRGPSIGNPEAIAVAPYIPLDVELGQIDTTSDSSCLTGSIVLAGCYPGQPQLLFTGLAFEIRETEGRFSSILTLVDRDDKQRITLDEGMTNHLVDMMEAYCRAVDTQSVITEEDRQC